MTDETNDKRESLFKTLSTEVELAPWNLLETHQKRGAVIEVKEGLDLVDVAVTIVLDEIDKITEWLTDTSLIKLPDDIAEGYSKQNIKEQINFQFIIVQPYVLIQKIKEDKTKEEISKNENN